MPTDIALVSISESSGLDDRGYSLPMMRATFKVRGHGPYFVELPKKDYSADSLDKLIQDHAAQIVTLRDKYPGA